MHEHMRKELSEPEIRTFRKEEGQQTRQLGPDQSASRKENDVQYDQMFDRIRNSSHSQVLNRSSRSSMEIVMNVFFPKGE